MSAPSSPERGSECEDINTFSEESTASAELVLNETSLGEVEELIPNENGQELTSLEVSEFQFIRSKPCTDILHCREIMYTIINICFKISQYIESDYRHDDILAVNNDTIATLPISELFGWIEKLSNEVKRDLKANMLPPSSTYQESVDHIMYHLRAIAVIY